MVLAQALEWEDRRAEADEAYALADEDPGEEPSTASILLARSHLAFTADRSDAAIRFVLEAAAADPRHVKDVTECIPLIGPDFAAMHGDWVVENWWPTLRAAELDATSLADVELTAAMVELCRGRFAGGQALLDGAVQISPHRCRELVPSLLESEGLLATAGSQGRAATLQACAIAWRTIGRDDRALEAVTVALSEGFASGDDPEAETYRLRAELRLARGDSAGAASDLFEAGCRFGWREDFDEALRLLESAAELDPDRQEIYWYWTDNLRISAAGSDDEAALLEKALALWERGAQKGAIEATDAWAYLVRACVFEARSDLDPEFGANSLWRAVVDAESALALDPELLLAWTTVSRLLRSLGYYGISSHALARGDELCGDELDVCGQPVLGEQVAHWFSLDPDRVPDALEQYRQLFGRVGGWVDMVVGLTAVRLGEFERGIASLEASLKAAADKPHRRHRRLLLARARLVAGDVDRGSVDCEHIAAELRAAPARVTDTWERARLACFTGHLDEARALVGDMERQLSTSGLRSIDVDWLSILIYLAEGDGLGAQDRTERMLQRNVPIGDLIDLDQDMSIVGRCFEGRYKDEDVVRTLRDRVRKHREDVRPPTAHAPSAEREVRQILADELPAFARVASTAHLAMLHGEAHWLAEAARIYAGLEDTIPPLPTAPEGFRRTVEALLIACEEAVRAGRADEEVIRQLDEIFDLVHGRADSDEVLARTTYVLALVRVLRGTDPVAALSHAVDRAERFGGRDSMAALAETWQELLPDVSAYWLVDDALATRGTSETGVLRAGIRPYLARRLHAASDEVDLGVQGTPLALELGADLIPLDAETNWEQWDLFTLWIPQFKANLENRTGLRHVAVRVRGSADLVGGDYAIVIDDCRSARGTTVPGWCFVPDQVDFGEGVEAILAADPRDGRMGGWVPIDHAHPHNGTCMSAVQYAVAHLETEVHWNLSAFLTVDAVENLLAGWEQDPSVASLLNATLPDRRARCRFAWVIRALARQQVLPLDARTILEATASTGIDEDLWSVVRAVRLALRESLPFSEAAAITLEPDLEKRLVAGDDRGSAADSATVWELLTLVRKALPEHLHGFVVVADPEVRPLVERLVQRVFPDVAVLSGDEVGSAT